MKRVLLVALLIFAVLANPVLAKVADCCVTQGDSHMQDGKTDKSDHPAHHCCHSNNISNAGSNIESVVIDFISNTFEVTQIELRSLYEPSPLLEPPSQA